MVKRAFSGAYFWCLFGVYFYKNRRKETNVRKVEISKNRMIPPFIALYKCMQNSKSIIRLSSSPPWRVDKKDVNPFFLVFMRVCGLLDGKSEKRFYRGCPRQNPQRNPHKRGFRLIFQVGGPAFLRSAALFPVVKCVEVSGMFIDRLTKAPNGPKSSPQNTRG